MRRNGILMHISSLPSPYGIGSMGVPSYRFIDFLHEAGQSLWQMLPLSPTSFGDSPYQSFSVFAGNPYFIDLDMMYNAQLITKKELESSRYQGDIENVDYEWLYSNRRKLFANAFKKFDTENKDYLAFCKKNTLWLDDYALFMALKDAHEGRAWYEWERKYKTRTASALKNFSNEHRNDIELYKMQQYLFFSQWEKLKKYANGKGINIIGDMPIYTAYDSSDVWANTHLFELDRSLTPINVAGCPPDAFSEDGQRWGNPLYRWDVMAEDGYGWFCRRMKSMSSMYDIVRLDHFRGFAEYCSIPYEDDTAVNGVWVKGPGLALFEAIKRECGNCSIIAEDLGFITPSVKKLLADCGFPGIKVMQFAFDPTEESEYLPHNFERNCVVYTGTHDNDTIMGWFAESPEEWTDYAIKYLRLTKEEGYNWGMIKAAMASNADTCILQMQDLIGLDNKARMNTPSTLGGNWAWRIKEECINFWLAGIMKKLTETYCRFPKAD